MSANPAEAPQPSALEQLRELNARLGGDIGDYSAEPGGALPEDHARREQEVRGYLAAQLSEEEPQAPQMQAHASNGTRVFGQGSQTHAPETEPVVIAGQNPASPSVAEVLSSLSVEPEPYPDPDDAGYEHQYGPEPQHVVGPEVFAFFDGLRPGERVRALQEYKQDYPEVDIYSLYGAHRQSLQPTTMGGQRQNYVQSAQGEARSAAEPSKRSRVAAAVGRFLNNRSSAMGQAMGIVTITGKGPDGVYRTERKKFSNTAQQPAPAPAPAGPEQSASRLPGEPLEVPDANSNGDQIEGMFAAIRDSQDPDARQDALDRMDDDTRDWFLGWEKRNSRNERRTSPRRRQVAAIVGGAAVLAVVGAATYVSVKHGSDTSFVHHFTGHLQTPSTKGHSLTGQLVQGSHAGGKAGNALGSAGSNITHGAVAAGKHVATPAHQVVLTPNDLSHANTVYSLSEHLPQGFAEAQDFAKSAINAHDLVRETNANGTYFWQLTAQGAAKVGARSGSSNPADVMKVLSLYSNGQLAIS